MVVVLASDGRSGGCASEWDRVLVRIGEVGSLLEDVVVALEWELATRDPEPASFEEELEYLRLQSWARELGHLKRELELLAEDLFAWERGECFDSVEFHRKLSRIEGQLRQACVVLSLPCSAPEGPRGPSPQGEGVVA